MSWTRISTQRDMKHGGTPSKLTQLGGVVIWQLLWAPFDRQIERHCVVCLTSTVSHPCLCGRKGCLKCLKCLYAGPMTKICLVPTGFWSNGGLLRDTAQWSISLSYCSPWTISRWLNDFMYLGHRQQPLLFRQSKEINNNQISQN